MDVALSALHSVGSDEERRTELADYKQALDFLFARTTGGFKFGLERTVQLLEHLGNPHRAYPSVHVAGTNGKGSSSHMLAAILQLPELRQACTREQVVWTLSM